MKKTENKKIHEMPSSKTIGVQSDDWRLIENGRVILAAEGYADQPYFLRADDGAIVLVCTTGSLEEGQQGQHIISSRSEDNGFTWSKPVQIEPPNAPEASWAVLHKTPSGRLYTFYTYNADNIREVPGNLDTYPDGKCRRMDTLGHFVFKYSDDNGKSWSSQRFTVPVREFEIDRKNPLGGKVRFFWNVGKPFTHEQKVYLPIIKVGSFGKGFFASSEGALVCSANLQTEADVSKITFQTLPDGDIGIQAPQGQEPVSEEHSFVVLSDGSFFCVFRTISGYSACCYSRDGGHTWTKPVLMRQPGGKPIKNPRAANFIWKLSGNRYLYWFHNNSNVAYHDRNPAWCLAGFEVDTPLGKKLEFSQPEILLYTTGDINRRMSYPDLLELDDGSLLISETEKLIARIHPIPHNFIDKISKQNFCPPLADSCDLLLDWNKKAGGCIAELGKLPKLFERWAKKAQERNGGITLNLQIDEITAGYLLNNTDTCGKGFNLSITEQLKIRIDLFDGRVGSFLQSSRSLKEDDLPLCIAVVIDGNSQIISIIINGEFDDGGQVRQFGWGKLHPELQDINAQNLKIAGNVRSCRIFNRALLTAEVVAEHNSK